MRGPIADVDAAGVLHLRVNLRAVRRPVCWLLIGFSRAFGLSHDPGHEWVDVLGGTWADHSGSLCRRCGKFVPLEFRVELRS